MGTMVKIVLIATSADELANGHKTGLWLEEIAVPYYIFREKGYQVILASIKGGEVPLDKGSLSGDFYLPVCKTSMEDAAATSKLQKSIAIKDIDVAKEEIDAIFLSGGHGTCVDFVHN